jgi:hypothetical protein
MPEMIDRFIHSDFKSSLSKHATGAHLICGDFTKTTTTTASTSQQRQKVRTGSETLQQWQLLRSNLQNN